MTDGPRQEPVTVSINRRVLPGREADYENWVHGVAAVAARFPGFLGVNVLRAGTSRNYVIITRFNSWDHALAWEGSSERAEWVHRLDGLVEGPTQMEKATGLEASGQMGYSACALSPTTALVEMLRFELMVERGLFEAATSIREEAQHEALCRIGCFGERDRHLHRR